MANNDLTVVTAATHEPLTVNFVKDYLRVDTTADDHLIEELVKASRLSIERGTGRQLVTTTYDWKIDRFADCIEIPKPPLQSVTSIDYLDEDGASQTLLGSVYDVHIDREPGEIRLAYNQSWPNIRGGHKDITIRFVCGYGAFDDVPADIRLLALKMIARDYDLRTPGAASAEDWVLKQMRWSNKIAEVH